MTRKTQLGWLTAGAALGFASVIFGPKLFDRLHSQASAETKPEKTTTAFDQVAQVWAKPKGGNEEQEPPAADSAPAKKVDKGPAKAPDLPKEDTNKSLPPMNADESLPPALDVPAATPPDTAKEELPPPSEKGPPEPTEKPSTRLRPTEAQLVDPPPAPPKADDVKSSPPDLPKVSAIPPQSDLASPPPVSEKRGTPETRAPVEVLISHAITSIPDSRPPDLNDPLIPAAQPGVVISGLKNQPPAPTLTVKVMPTPKKLIAPAKAKALPLTGQHPCVLDDTRGLVLPKSVREQMGESEVLFLTPGADQALWLTTAASLEKLTDKMEKKADSEADGKPNHRHYFALTERVTVDKTGRLVLPAALAAGAELKQEVVLVGVGDHVEIWDAARWQKYCQAEGE